jgi:hypothetical protein
MRKRNISTRLTLAKTGATGKRGSRRIQVTARFEITFETDLDADDFAALEAGDAPLDDYVDESTPYGLLSGNGACDMEWEPVSKLIRKTKKRRA